MARGENDRQSLLGAGSDFELSTEQDQLTQIQWVNDSPPDIGSNEFSHSIQGKTMFTVATVDLKGGEEIMVESGKMFWMDGNLAVDTKMHGTTGEALCRACCSGSACFFNKFTGPGKITIGMDACGNIVPFAVSPGNGWWLSQGAFLAGNPSVRVTGKFPGCLTCLCAGENYKGAALQFVYAEAPSMFFAGSTGDIVRHEVPAGKTLVVDSGMFFAAHESVSMSIGLASGLCACFFGQEGFMLKFTGPCVVFTQSRDPNAYAPSLISLLCAGSASAASNGAE